MAICHQKLISSGRVMMAIYNQMYLQSLHHDSISGTSAHVLVIRQFQFLEHPAVLGQCSAGYRDSCQHLEHPVLSGTSVLGTLSSSALLAAPPPLPVENYSVWNAPVENSSVWNESNVPTSVFFKSVRDTPLMTCGLQAPHPPNHILVQYMSSLLNQFSSAVGKKTALGFTLLACWGSKFKSQAEHLQKQIIFCGVLQQYVELSTHSKSNGTILNVLIA